MNPTATPAGSTPSGAATIGPPLDMPRGRSIFAGLDPRRLAITIAIVIALIAAAVVAAWLAAENTMSPSADERRSMALLFGGIGLISAFVAISLHLVVQGSLRHRLTLVALVGPVLVAALFLSGAASMFLSDHDLQFSLILVALSAALATGTALLLVGPLSRDVRHLRHVAELVGDGDRDIRAGLDRPDELGELSQSIDDMVRRLGGAEAERDRLDQERSVMMASLSHDMRTPLAAMRATLEAVQDGLSPDPERYLASMSDDIDAMQGMIDDLFMLGRFDAGAMEFHIEPVDLAELVDGTVESMMPLAKRVGVTLRTNDLASALAQGDPSALGRVLRNLVDNAIRHTPEGGVVTVEAYASAEENNVLVRVTDQGPGFAPEFCEAAFERFSRADESRERARGGAGLGLAVASEIVTGLHGAIWAEPGPGGRVSFTLPASPSRRQPHTPTSAR